MNWKNIISGVVGAVLTGAVLWLIGIIGKVPTIIVPTDAVIAFASNKCPDGWALYEKAKGRTVIGVGEGNLDQNDKPLSSRTLEQTSGEEQHVLEQLEMPEHSHGGANLKDWRVAWGRNNGNNFGPKDVGETSWGLGYIIRSSDPNSVWRGPNFMSSKGGGKSHNNMQPFVSLLYCIKE